MAFVIYVIIWRTTRRVRGLHPYTDLRGLHDRDPLELFTSWLSSSFNSLEFVSWRQCAPLERASGYRS